MRLKRHPMIPPALRQSLHLLLKMRRKTQKDSTALGHCPRRSSSSKDPPSEKPPSPESSSSHAATLRTRSLPLNASDGHNQGGLEGDSLEIILSFSTQVSCALMRSMQSLPHSPCPSLSNPWGAMPGSHPDTTDEESLLAEKLPFSPVPDSSEKGFSVSLAELRECTIERGEESEKEDRGPERPLTTPSAACAQSVISALPPQEIQKMIQEVKDLDEDTLKQLEDIHVVILHKEEGAGLGFSIAGGIDQENKATTVRKTSTHVNLLGGGGGGGVANDCHAIGLAVSKTLTGNPLGSSERTADITGFNTLIVSLGSTPGFSPPPQRLCNCTLVYILN
uniref:Pro-interleukin-16 n=1 Tax=Electrophorus electricus TaxID=8005 RepID=A0AAY5EU01_ELEEL